MLCWLFSLNEVCQSIRGMRQHYSISEDSIDFYILHQAQKLILDGIARECEIDLNKVLRSYEEYAIRRQLLYHLPYAIWMMR